jgi:murein DD-endopeptidase MepM/ murein hydrolase activator NlpD
MKLIKYLKSHASRKSTKRLLAALAVTAIASAGIGVQFDSTDWQASTLSGHDAFDGTVPPIQWVRDTVHMTGNEYDLPCSALDSDLLIPAPAYNSEALTFPSSSLVWGNEAHDEIRIAKSFYSVTYAGNYRFDDSAEGEGSHNGMDLVVCAGAPVHSIANGLVHDAGTSGSWGNYVVIEHQGVPDPDNPSGTTTLYSTYNHLSSFSVSEGEELSKNDVIGTVGKTGTATTEHLHFSLEKETAPHLPYWAFTSAEASAAGYSFWEAVNYGVGQDNLYRYSVHPMEFIQEHLDEALFEASEWTWEAPEVSELEEVDEDDEPATAEELMERSDAKSPFVETVVEEEDEGPRVDEGEITRIELNVPGELSVGDQGMYQLVLFEENGTNYKGPFEGAVTLEVSDEEMATLGVSSLEYEDFHNGRAGFTLYAARAGEYTLSFTYNGVTYESDVLKVDDDSEPFHEFEIRSDGSYSTGTPEVIQILALDRKGEVTTRFDDDDELEIELLSGEGEFSQDSFDAEDFEDDGIVEFTFTSEGYESIRFEVNHGSDSYSHSLNGELFSDFSPEDKYYEAVKFLHQKGTISGYEDASFQPDRASSRIETLKIVFNGLDVDLSDVSLVVYKDTQAGQWYTPFLSAASRLGIVQGYSDGNFKPTVSMNRVEFLKVLFSTLAEQDDLDVNVDSDVKRDPYRDVSRSAWHAPYVQFSKEYNLFPGVGHDFDPSQEITRLEVATVIYRLLAVIQNAEDNGGELESYKDSMVPSL